MSPFVKKRLKSEMQFAIPYILFIFVILIIIILSGCAKRGMLVRCGKEDYTDFLNTYKPYYEINNISGNGDIEITNEDNNLFGKFSLIYSKKENRWAITIYGIFGMVLSEIEIQNDSINISSSLLEEPIKSSIKKFNLEGFTGIPINAKYIPFLTTGRVYIKTSNLPTSCIKKNDNLTEFLYDETNKEIRIGWKPKDNKVVYFKSFEKNMQRVLEVKFRDYKNINSISLPYSILFSIKGKKEGYLRLKYSYIKMS